MKPLKRRRTIRAGEVRRASGGEIENTQMHGVRILHSLPDCRETCDSSRAKFNRKLVLVLQELHRRTKVHKFFRSATIEKKKSSHPK